MYCGLQGVFYLKEIEQIFLTGVSLSNFPSDWVCSVQLDAASVKNKPVAYSLQSRAGRAELDAPEGNPDDCPEGRNQP